VRGFYTLARQPGEKSRAHTDGKRTSGPYPDPQDGGSLNVLPDLMRRLFSVGFSSFFFTEEAIRKALGDTLPQDWSDFAVEQSDRTRAEFFERLSVEIGRTLENMDFAEVADRLLDGKTIEINASIRLRPATDSDATKLKIRSKGA